MAFQDIMQGIQFFSGLSAGFSKQLQTQRAEHEKEQLRLLTLLHQDGTHDIDTAQPGDIVPPSGADRFFGGGSYKTKEGIPAFKVGGNYFTAKKKPPIDISRMFGGDTSVPASTDTGIT